MTYDGHDADEVTLRLVQWADEQPTVRAMLLTSTRAVPHAPVDALSDYDVILVLEDTGPFLADRRWIDHFGKVLVAYWDPPPDPETGIGRSGNVVQYEDGLKIDFGLWPVAILDHVVRLPTLPAELDAGYRVLVDKDRLTDSLRAPSYTGYIPSPPDEARYRVAVNDFFIGVPYVAKGLLRDELLPARWVLDYDMRYVYLLPMLEWRMECDHGWSVSPGALGKGLKRRLPPAIWAELEGTFAGADLAETWDALFRMIALFRRVARDVAAHLSYVYPEDLDCRVTAYARRMRDREHGAATPG